MSDIQKIIKYLAIAFAIYLCIVIIGGIVGVLGSFMFIFAPDKGISENLERISVDTNYAIKKMNIDIKGAHLIIEDSEEFYIETNNSYIKVDQNKDEITIKEKSHSWFRNNNESKLIIHLPSSIVFEKFYLDAGAGKIDISNIKAEDVDLELGAGQVIIGKIETSKKTKINGGAGEFIIKSGTLTNLDFDMGVGHTEIEASILGNSDIDAGVGELNINILGDEKDYEIEVDKGIGNIEIDGRSIGSNTKTGNGFNKLDIDGGVGRITIDFICENKSEENKEENPARKTFTKTYKVLNKTSYQENNSYYLTLQLFQGEVDTVIVKNTKENIEEGKTYEFTFAKDNSKNHEDKIKFIFSNYELVEVKETDKVGLAQIQESIN